MKKVLFTICIVLCACGHSDEFYNPDTVINSQKRIRTDSIYGYDKKEMLSKIEALSSIDKYLIISQQSKDTVFQILNMENDSIIANFGHIGHARNEFQRYPKTIYCERDRNGLPLLFVLDGVCTKVIDLEESITSNSCILRNIIKENKDSYFYYTYHVGNESCFVYKKVSYKDARDAVYTEPQYYMMTGKNKYEWNIHPNIIHPDWSNMVDAAYSNMIRIKPDGSKAISVSNFIDILTIFDLSTKKTLGIVNPESYTYAFLEQEGGENNIKKHLRWFNTSVCVSDNCFIVLKDGNLYQDVLKEDTEDRCSSINKYDWNGLLTASFILDKNLLNIAFYEKADILYAVSLENNLYKYTLK